MLSLVGCRSEQDRKLRVGTIDTARILTEMPQYKEVQGQIQSDESSFRAHLPDPNTRLSPQETSRLQDELQKKRRDWEKVVRDLMKQSVQKITDSTQEVSQQRDIDIVVVNTTTDSVYFSAGQDITLDVLLKLQK